MKPQSYHFIGIGGIGINALAHILLDKKIKVSGSDLAAGPTTKNLVDSGAQVHIGHSAAFVDPQATVIYSTDIRKNNPEYLQAIEMKCKE